MTADSRVSVIVPAYNAARWIGRTLHNVLQQTHRDIEVLVVDDGSRDDTARIVEQHARADGRIRLLTQANAGVSAARNLGLRQAAGAYVAPLDADDLWHPTKLEKQLTCLAAQPAGVGVAYCHFAVIDGEDRVVLPRRIYHTPTGHVYPQLMVANIVGNASAPLIRRGVLDEAGMYDEAFKEGCEDLDFYLRLAEWSEFALVPEFLVGYRRSEQSMSMDIPKMERSIAQLTAKILARHPDVPRRLVRWRNGNMYRYLALNALMTQDRRRALRLAARSVAADPLLLASWVLTRARARLIRDGQSEAEGLGPDFIAADPRPGTIEGFRPTGLDRRRNSVAARIRIEPSAA